MSTQYVFFLDKNGDAVAPVHSRAIQIWQGCKHHPATRLILSQKDVGQVCVEFALVSFSILRMPYGGALRVTMHEYKP